VKSKLRIKSDVITTNFNQETFCNPKAILDQMMLSSAVQTIKRCETKTKTGLFSLVSAFKEEQKKHGTLTTITVRNVLLFTSLTT
jgi:hypothetical protein